MLECSQQHLKWLAALAWYSGSVALVAKGSQLLVEAAMLQPAGNWHWISLAAGILIGLIKARFIFIKSCRRNLDRIARIDQPRAWQFFRPQFMGFLALMIIAGGLMSHNAHGHYWALNIVVVIDYSVGMALFCSGFVFWRHDFACNRGGACGAGQSTS
jgi:uncharacterized membrane protein